MCVEKTIAFAIILALLLALAKTIGKKRGGFIRSTEWPYYAKQVLTAPEQVLYHRLVTALPGRIVLAQVQVSRVLGAKKGSRFHEWNNRINRLSYDFLVCDEDSTVLAAIELDDRSHDSAARRETDDKKTKATAAAGIRLLRWHAKSIPSVVEIQRALVIPPPFK